MNRRCGRRARPCAPLMDAYGKYRWLSDSHVLLKDDSGEPQYVIGNIRDVTEVKLAQEHIENALIESQRKETEISGLLRSARAVLEEPDFENAAQVIFQNCKELLNADAGYLGLKTKPDEEEIILYQEPGSFVSFIDKKVTMPITGVKTEMYSSKQIIIDNNFSGSFWSKLLPDAHLNLRNVLYAPIIIENNTVGGMAFANKENNFNANDSKLAGAFGELAAISLRNFRDKRKVVEHKDLLHTILESSAEGVLALNEYFGVTHWNSKFVEIWGVQNEMIKLNNGESIINYLKSKTRQSDKLKIWNLKSLRNSTEVVAERITFKDERIVEAYSSPLISGDELTGRIWTFRDVSGILRVEQHLRESERRFRIIFEKAPAGIALVDVNYQIFRANNAYCFFLGYSEDELKKKKIQDITHPDDLGENIELQDKLRNQDVSGFQFEKRFIKKDGEICYGILLASVITDERDKPIYFLEQVLDITKRKKAEKEALDREAKLSSVFKAAPIGIAIMLNNQIQQVNDRFCEIAGYKTEELVGGYPGIMFSPENKWKGIYQKMTIQMERRGFSMIETELIRKNRSNLIAILNSSPIDSNNFDLGITITLQDITERKLAEEQIRESEERYRRLFEDDLTGDYIATPDGRLITCNPAFIRIFGFSSIQEALDTPTKELYFSGKNRSNFIDLIKKRGRLELFEQEMRRRDGAPIIILENAIGVFNDKNELTQIRGYLIDITERKNLEAQLRQAMKMESIGRLAGGIAHDFNNLLTVISGNVEMSLLSVDERDPLHHDLTEINKAANRATDLTRQLLAFSRKQTLQPKVVNLNKIVLNLHKMLKRVIGEDISLEIIADDRLWTTNVDPGQIEQVIINMVVNARDAMPKGGKLYIETKNAILSEKDSLTKVELKSGQYVTLSIMDTGMGMKDEVMSKIFDPFFTTKTEGKGTGLGLSTVYGIIKQSGGDISVESKLDEGSSFTIYLPASGGEEIQEEETRSGAQIPHGKENLLIVEDEEGVRYLAQRVLKMHGYKVTTAQNGGEAWLICQKMEKPFDLIITDVIMPGISGPEFVSRIREMWRNVKSLYISGYSEEAIAQHGILNPDAPYMQKPFPPVDLVKKVREVLDMEI